MYYIWPNNLYVHKAYLLLHIGYNFLIERHFTPGKNNKYYFKILLEQTIKFELLYLREIISLMGVNFMSTRLKHVLE